MERLKRIWQCISDHTFLILSVILGGLFVLWRREQGKRIEAETERDIVEKKTEIKQIEKEAEEAENEYESAKDAYRDAVRKLNGDS